MSPPVSEDTDDGRRSVGMGGGAGRGKPVNGNMQPFPQQQQQPPGSSQGRRPPTRPARDEQGASELAEVRNGLSDAEGSQDLRQRMKSPEGTRSRSPTNMIAADRSMSPTGGALGQAANAAALALARGGGAQGRSPSPGGAPSDAFVYKTGQINGFAAINGRVSPSIARPGSAGNIAADLVRDVRAKDAELEQLRRREQWMRAALSKATKAGFSWNDLSIDEDELKDHDIDNAESRKLVDLAFKLKQERAALQVSFKNDFDPAEINLS